MVFKCFVKLKFKRGQGSRRLGRGGGGEGLCWQTSTSSDTHTFWVLPPSILPVGRTNLFWVLEIFTRNKHTDQLPPLPHTIKLLSLVGLFTANSDRFRQNSRKKKLSSLKHVRGISVKHADNLLYVTLTDTIYGKDMIHDLVCHSVTQSLLCVIEAVGHFSKSISSCLKDYLSPCDSQLIYERCSQSISFGFLLFSSPSFPPSCSSPICSTFLLYFQIELCPLCVFASSQLVSRTPAWSEFCV